MPEMYFRVRWPDALETEHYSPSLVIKDYLVPHQELDLPEFLSLMRAALAIASDRVKEKYGFACSRARKSLAEIERQAAPFLSRDDARVTVMEFSQ